VLGFIDFLMVEKTSASAGWSHRACFLGAIMRDLPPPGSSADVVLDWLHEEGWNLAHAGQEGECVVTGSKSGKSIRTTGKTLEEARLLATEQARLHDAQSKTAI
jgi:hypothetical protein